MISTKIIGFYKNEDCPSSNDLLDFQKNDLTSELLNEVLGHLETCDFCSAEAEFYSHYPQEENTNEPVEIAGIPVPLFELAEALLKKRHTDTSSLDALLKEKGGMMQKCVR